jgi:peptidoglycan-associated lipoprotein
MTKKFLVGVGILAMLLAGCGQQPELDVDADQNKTEKLAEKNVTKAENTTVENAQPQETDLTDTTTVQVTEDSVVQKDVNQNLAKLLAKEVVHFDFDKYNIRPDQMPIVEEVANILKDAKGNFTVRIEGNCDEWGTDEYNYALGLKRAKTVKQALIDLGVPAEKLTIISYGESNPVCTEHNKACWAKNRRDNFTLLP